MIFTKRFNKLLLLMMLGLFAAFSVEAKVGNDVLPSTPTKTTLSLKTRLIAKHIGKQVKKQKKKFYKIKKAQKQQSFFGKLFGGLILIIVGVFIILGALFSIELIGVLLGILTIIIGAVLMVWSVFDIAF